MRASINARARWNSVLTIHCQNRFVLAFPWADRLETYVLEDEPGKLITDITPFGEGFCLKSAASKDGILSGASVPFRPDTALGPARSEETNTEAIW
jgi:hypothetical protein